MIAALWELPQAMSRTRFDLSASISLGFSQLLNSNQHTHMTIIVIVIVIVIVIIIFVYLRLSNATDNIRYKK